MLAGEVVVNEQVARKASEWVRDEDRLGVKARDRYVSRGGHKLAHALQAFSISVRSVTAIDVGASTGGFTDCLLQQGAERVYAVDVGRGQLAWKLRQDPRVVVMEGVNARYLTPANFPKGFIPVDLGVIDCSFISLSKLIGTVAGWLRDGGLIVALIKPQFEAGKAEADRGRGVITDPAIHQRVIDTIRSFVEQHHPRLMWHGHVESPLRGPAGNKEFLVRIEKLEGNSWP